MSSFPLSLPLHFVYLLCLIFTVVKFLWFCVTFYATYFKVSLIIWKKCKSETVNISDAHTAEEGGQEANSPGQEMHLCRWADALA